MSDKKITFSVIENEDNAIPEPIEKSVSGKDYLFYGEDNLYPELLFGCYDNCTMLQSIINGLSDYIAGSGITEDFDVTSKGDKCSELLKKVALDYIIFGAFSIQVRRNSYGDVVALDYVDVSKIRLSEDEKTVYYCRKWSKYARDIRKYDRWDKGLKQSNSVFYYKNPKSRGVYGTPIWKAAIEDALTAIEITHFHYSAIRNNFVPSAVVNFNNGVPTDEQQDEIEAKLNEKFSGSSNAARLLVSFNDNKDSAVTVERLSEDGFDSKYQALRDSVRDNMLTAFRASGQLFGVLPEQTGFNSVEYLNAFALYKETVVKPLQQEIEDAFKRLGYDITLNEFVVEFKDNGETTVA